MTRRLTPIVCALAVAMAAAGGACRDGANSRSRRPQGLGKTLAQTPSRGLVATADLASLVFVGDVRPPAEKTAPEGILQGVLQIVPAAGGALRLLGGGVPTTDDGFRVSADGKKIAFLTGYRFFDHAGDLQLADAAAGEPKLLAPDVSFYGFSGDGAHLGYVSNGQAMLLDLLSGQKRQLGTGAATFSFSPDWKSALVRRQGAAGGALDFYPLDDKGPLRLATGVGEYKYSPDGRHVAYTARSGGPADPFDLYVGPAGAQALEKVAGAVADFAFSPDSRFIALVSGVTLAKPYAELLLVPAKGGKPRKVGDYVEYFRFSPDSSQVAWSEFHEDNRRGIKWHRLMVAPTEPGAARKLGDGVRNFLWSGKGKFLAFMQIFEKPHYSVDLMLHRVGEDAEPKRVEKGAFTYAFTPDEKWLFYRSACVREGRACDLWRMQTDAQAKPSKVAEGVWDFRSSESGERLIVTYARADSVAAADLAFASLGDAVPSPRGVDQYTLSVPIFLDKEGKRLAYVVGERKREGVYVADLP